MTGDDLIYFRDVETLQVALALEAFEEALLAHDQLDQRLLELLVEDVVLLVVVDAVEEQLEGALALVLVELV